MNILDYQAIFDYRGESYNSASNKYPNARHFERQALIDLVDVNDNQNFIDVPAGGGYLAEGIRESFGPTLSITCIEPAKKFAQTIPSSFTVINSPIDKIPLEDRSIDVVASLAGLHHIEDRAPVFREWGRLLKAGGQLAVADVAAGSGPDEFLNVFVDRYTPQGHKGIFIQGDEFSKHFENNELELKHDSLVQVPWLFDSHHDMAEFCIKLFYLLNVSHEQVLESLSSCVGIKSFNNGKIGIEWELRYACATKN